MPNIFLSVSDNSAFSGLLFPPCSRRVICSLFLIFDLFGQIIEVDPTVHLLLQIGFQLLLFLGEFLESDVIIRRLRHLFIQPGDFFFQGGDIAVDCFVFSLFVESEFQLFFAARAG